MKIVKKSSPAAKPTNPNRAQRRAEQRATKTGRTPPTHERWFREAMRIESIENPLSTPYEVFLEEARSLAGFVLKYWKATDTTPGLARLHRRLPATTSQEIHELIAAVQTTQTEATLAVASPKPLTDRADTIIEELASALAFTLDDDVEDEDDARLSRVRAAHAKRGDGAAAVGQDLLNHATLAERLRERLVQDDEEFDAGLIDEAFLIAAKLTAATLRPPALDAEVSDAAVAPPDASEDPLALRNRLLRLLNKRVALVRRAARRVFAKHPDILADATSAYEREKRAERRKAARARKVEAPVKDEPKDTPPKPENVK